MAAAVLVSGPALRPLLRLVDQTNGAAGEGLEAHGDNGEATEMYRWSHGSFTVWFLSLHALSVLCITHLTLLNLRLLQ